MSAVRKFKNPTPERLQSQALHYLGRYAASSAGLRKILMHKLHRAARQDPAFAADTAGQKRLEAAIDTLIVKLTAQGLLNNQAYADMKVASLRRAGGSSRAIRQKLQLKGIGDDLGAAALAAHATDHEDAEIQAALKLAKRRRLGPFSAKARTPDQKRKDMAALCRAGFGLDIAKKIIGGTIEEEFLD